jgi:hypothetical protein
MGKVIQQIPFPDGRTLYLCGWDDDNRILRYRCTGSGSQEVSEEVKIEGETVYLADYNFPTTFLLKFIEENSEDDNIL